jgi:hypothetical protein
VREDPIVLEPAQIVGMADEDRRAGGGAENPGRAHDGADEAVHERRLPGAGRAADHHQHRGIHLAEARQEVVVGLGDEIVASAPRVGRARNLELQAYGGELVT